jgi:microcystin-dependent protein
MSARNSYNVAPIPGDNNGGSGGGGGDGPSADGGLPVGSVIPYAGATTPPKWLLCNGTEYNQAIAEDLYDVIGYSYGVNPSATSIVQGGGGAIYGYDIATNTLSIAGTNVVNTFIKVGTYIKLSGATVTTGVNINGAIILITTSNVAINGTGVGGNQYQGTFVNPLGTGVGGGSGMITTFTRFSVPVPDLRLASPIGSQTGTINLGTSGGASTYQLTAQNLPQHRHGVFVPGGLSSQVNGSQNRAGDPNVDATFTTVPGETYPDTGALTPVANTAFSIRNPYVALNYIIKAQT